MKREARKEKKNGWSVYGDNYSVIAPRVDASGLAKEKGRVGTVVTPLPFLYTPPKISVWTLLFYLVMTVVLYLGWMVHETGYITPKTGVGYYLGWTSGIMMFLTILYPMRKRFSFLQKTPSTKYWFKFHMMLGVAGPVLAIIHSNFSLGSLNSRVLMLSALVITGSGFFGLHVYRRIHCSLYNRRLTYEELKRSYERNTDSLVAFFRYAPSILERLRAIEKVVLAPPISVTESFVRLLTVGFRIRFIQFQLYWILSRVIRRKAKRENWDPEKRRRMKKMAKKYISSHMNASIRIAEFSFYERIFALWHLFHVPMFVLLLISGIVHVVVVHLF